MATLNVSLPDNLKTYVTQRVHNGEYSNASDYIRTLIRKDREQAPLATPDIPPQLLEEATRIQALPLDTESKRRLLAMYVMLEKKTPNPCAIGRECHPRFAGNGRRSATQRPDPRDTGRHPEWLRENFWSLTPAP